jgi:GAF domain-containing protein
MSQPLDETTQELFFDVGRLKALHDLSLLDNKAETVYDRFTQLVHDVLKTPVSLISLVAEDHQYFKSQIGLEEPWKSQGKTPLSHSFCQHVVATNQPLIVDNALENDLVKDNLAVRDMHVMAYLGVPLTLKDGTCLGSFCAIDKQVKNWDADDLAIMQELGGIIVEEFNLRAEVYIDGSRQPELDDLHQRIDGLISGLDTSIPKDEFLVALGTARSKCNL